jgi:hypothetical protein
MWALPCFGRYAAGLVGREEQTFFVPPMPDGALWWYKKFFGFTGGI